MASVPLKFKKRNLRPGLTFDNLLHLWIYCTDIKIAFDCVALSYRFLPCHTTIIWTSKYCCWKRFFIWAHFLLHAEVILHAFTNRNEPLTGACSCTSNFGRSSISHNDVWLLFTALVFRHTTQHYYSKPCSGRYQHCVSWVRLSQKHLQQQ